MSESRACPGSTGEAVTWQVLWVAGEWVAGEKKKNIQLRVTGLGSYPCQAYNGTPSGN